MFKKSSSDLADKFIPKQVQEQLKQVFDSFPNEVPIHLFSNKGDNKEAVQVARELLTALGSLSDKIKFEEHKLSDTRAKDWDVTRTPALVFAPERYDIQYLGVPLGEEGRTLIEMLSLIGLGDSRMNDQARRVVQRIDSPRKIMVFVSASCPYCPQQAINGVKAAVERPDMVSIKLVDTAFNQELSELYGVQGVPQTVANDILISQGAQPEELFAASLEQLEEQRYFIPESDAPVVEADLVIIGGGPAGLSAGIYAARSGLNAVVVDRENMGGQVALTPVVENYPGLAHIGGKNLVEIMVAHALEYVNVFPREAVQEIQHGEMFEVTTTQRRFIAKTILLATGASHRRLGAAGEDRYAGRGVSYCTTCDGPLFKGKKVAMVGGGNSAVTEALHLHHIGSDVTLIHRRDNLRAQDRLIQSLVEAKIPVKWNTEVKEIKGEEVVKELVLYNNKTDEVENFPVDGLFVAIGYDPAVELAKMAGVELNDEGFIKTDGRHRTNIPGIYSAGDVEGGYKQIVTAAGAGAAAAMTIFEDLTDPYWTQKKAAG